MPFFLFWFFLLIFWDFVADSLIDVIPHLFVVVWVFTTTAAAIAAHVENVFKPISYFFHRGFVGSHRFHCFSLRNWLGLPSTFYHFISGEFCLPGNLSTVLRIVAVWGHSSFIFIIFIKILKCYFFGRRFFLHFFLPFLLLEGV